MGAIIFFILMGFLFFSALFFIILNLIFISIWKSKKRKGKAPKKRHIVIPTIFLIISLMVELIPIGWIVFLRAVNSKESNKVVMAESGKMLYWGRAYEDFEMDGINYLGVSVGHGDKQNLGKPVANIRSESDEILVNKFMAKLFACDETSNLYSLENEKGFELYTTGVRTFSSEDQKDKVEAYYNDISNFDTRNCKYEYCVFAEVQDNKSEDDGIDYESIDKDITLDEGIFERIDKNSDNQECEKINIAEKYLKMRKEEKPGTCTAGFEEVHLYVETKDRLAKKEVYLALIDEQIYSISISASDYITAYPLTSEMNEYIKNTIFRDK